MKEEISLGELIVISLKFIKKNFIILVASLIIGGVIGYIKESRVVPKHSSEAVICSDLLEGNLLKEIISDFETATSRGNYSYLAKALSISIDSARKISNISIEVFKPEINYRTDVDLTHSKLHHCIKITCTSFSSNLFEVVEHELLKTFTNHEETKYIVEERKTNYIKNIEKINEDLVFLKNQRIKLYAQLDNGNSKIDINQFDSEGQFIAGYMKIAVLKELVLRTKAAVLMKPFNKMTIATYSKSKGIILMALVFILIAFLIAIYREIKI